jgi:hypothetical protein
MTCDRMPGMGGRRVGAKDRGGEPLLLLHMRLPPLHARQIESEAQEQGQGQGRKETGRAAEAAVRVRVRVRVVHAAAALPAEGQNRRPPRRRAVQARRREAAWSHFA